MDGALLTVLCSVVWRVNTAGALHSSLLKLHNRAHVHGLHPGEASKIVTWTFATYAFCRKRGNQAV